MISIESLLCLLLLRLDLSPKQREHKLNLFRKYGRVLVWNKAGTCLRFTRYSVSVAEEYKGMGG